MLDNYSCVRLTTDKYQTEGVGNGGLGYIIEVYEDAYEVEFSDNEGNTIAQIVVQPTEVTLEEPTHDPAQRGASQELLERAMVSTHQ